MKKALILAALVAIVAYRPRAADGVSAAPSIADQLGFGEISDVAAGLMPYLGFSPRGPYGSGYLTPVKNGLYGAQRFLSPYDASHGSIGGWGGGVGQQYDPWINGCFNRLGDQVSCHMSVN